MKILVTGGNGQVGWELNRQGRQSKHKVVTFDRNGLDISSADEIARVFAEVKPDLVINAAAYTAVDKAETESELAFAINRDAVESLARACKKQAIPLFHISTDYVFDGRKDKPYKESDPVAPLGVYGQSKLEGEQVVEKLLDQFIILRTAWVFGLHGHNFVKTILRVGKERDALKVVDDQLGGPTSAAGIAATLLSLADQYHAEGELAWGIYHYSGAPFTSWNGFATEIIKLGRKHGLIDHPVTVNPIPTEQYPTPAARPKNSRLSCSLLEQTFETEPDDWQAALAVIVRSLANSGD
jgi:dTDP-4-dehydrorhamnose reductase